MRDRSDPRSLRVEALPNPLPVLVVDDDAAWRAALKTWLEGEGFRVVILGRADWVTHAVDLHRPEVVLLDIHLPGANGLDVLDTVGRRWPTLPVIIMTAFGGPAVGDTARGRGAVGYLEKPFRMTSLVDEIRRAVRGPRSQRRTAGP